MPHRLPRPARLAITGVKLAVVGTISAVGLLGSGPTTSAEPTPEYPSPHGYVVQPVDDRPSPAERLLKAHTCSISGFETGEQPLSAVVRSAAGDLRFVDFDTGWEVYTRHGEARLVAVCLDEPPAS